MAEPGELQLPMHSMPAIRSPRTMPSATTRAVSATTPRPCEGCCRIATVARGCFVCSRPVTSGIRRLLPVSPTPPPLRSASRMSVRLYSSIQAFPDLMTMMLVEARKEDERIVGLRMDEERKRQGEENIAMQMQGYDLPPPGGEAPKG